MATFQLMIILLLMAGLVFVVWIIRTQSKNRKDAIGHIWATFYTEVGTSYSVRCPVFNNLVKAPPTAQEILEKKTKKGTQYFVRQDKTFDIAYPPGKPAWMQTTIPHTIYYEGNPEPQISRDPATRLEAIGTSEFMDNLDNEKMSELMVQFSDEMTELREQARNKISAKTVYLLLVVIVLTVVADTMVDFNLMGMISKITSYWGI